MRVVICDFEDSFTYNLFSELRFLNLEVEVAPLSEVKSFLESNINSKEKLAVALGPGPGHPDERPEVVEAVKKILNRENLFLLGVCLGHQIVARALGLSVGRSRRPSHGEVETIALSEKDRSQLGLQLERIQAQRYNSLSVPATSENRRILKELGFYWLEHDGEIQALKKGDLLTYQFHPESVGTSFRSLFFKPLKSFLL